MFVVASAAIFICMLLILVRLFAGPTLYDRILSANAFGTCTVLLIGVLGFLQGRPDFLDIALLYALINFVGTIAVLKYFRYRAIGDTSPQPAGVDNIPGNLKDRKRRKNECAGDDHRNLELVCHCRWQCVFNHWRDWHFALS